MSEELLQQGITALNKGRRAEARQLLERVVRENPYSEQGWLWLSGTVDTSEEQRFCLAQVVSINERNAPARQGLKQLGPGPIRAPFGYSHQPTPVEKQELPRQSRAMPVSPLSKTTPAEISRESRAQRSRSSRTWLLLPTVGVLLCLVLAMSVTVSWRLWQQLSVVPAGDAPGAIATNTPVSNEFPMTTRLFNRRDEEAVNGWKTTTVRLCFVNSSDRLVSVPSYLVITEGYVETLEQQTYPIEMIENSLSRAGLSVTERVGYRGTEWSEPFGIDFADRDEGPLLVPPHLTICGTPTSSEYTFYALSIRYAEAAHPTQVVLRTRSYGELVTGLADVHPSLPIDSNPELNGRPLADLVNDFFVDNDYYEFRWNGRCSLEKQYGAGMYHVLLPFTVRNKDLFGEQSVNINTPFYVYNSAGALQLASERIIELTIGPGQTVQDNLEIDYSGFHVYDVPLYLLHSTGDGEMAVYQLNCPQP